MSKEPLYPHIPKSEIIRDKKPKRSRPEECPICSGTGRLRGRICPNCAGHGTIA
jgi:DnaJ-class molecular chaperone